MTVLLVGGDRLRLVDIPPGLPFYVQALRHPVLVTTSPVLTARYAPMTTYVFEPTDTWACWFRPSGVAAVPVWRRRS